MGSPLNPGNLGMRSLIESARLGAGPGGTGLAGGSVAASASESEESEEASVGARVDPSEVVKDKGLVGGKQFEKGRAVLPSLDEGSAGGLTGLSVSCKAAGTK